VKGRGKMPTQSKWIITTLVALSAVAMPGFAQNTGWRKFGEPSQQQQQQQQPAEQADQANQGPPPSALTVPAGTWITVRVNQPISTDHNQQGDTFSASLAQPLVANGRVIARRGQMVAGVVAESLKAGRVKGTSQLKLQLTEISLADGRQLPINSHLVERRGNTSTGSDAAAIGTTTGIGAAIGAAADGGFGAGMGAIAGAAASTIGVLVTRGRPTEVYPETPLTFRLEAPITIPAEYADNFPPVMQEDYEQRSLARTAPTMRMAPPPPYYYGGGYPYYYGPSYYSGYYGGFYGPSLYFSTGRHYYGGRGYRR
jgi:hypothetical protein